MNNDLMLALARIYVAFFHKEYKTDEQFEAIDFAVSVFQKYPAEKKEAFAILELAGLHES